MNGNSLISVIMPVFNAECYLAEAMESVLNQTYQPLEVICIDDGSTDRSLAVLKTFGKKITLIISEENGGVSVARNRGVRVACGGYLAFMDADDIWKPEKLSYQMEQFKQNPQLDVSFTYSRFFISPELPKAVQDLRHVPAEPIAGYLAGTSLIKTSSFKKAGGFNPQLRLSEFIDWFERAKSLGMQYALVNETLHLRRVHTNNIGVRERSLRIQYLKVVKEALNRKRRQA